MSVAINHSVHQLRLWIKAQETPLASFMYRAVKQLRHFEMPDYKVLFELVLRGHQFITHTIGWIMRVLYWTPLFKSQISNTQRQLYLYGGLPLVTGNLMILMGHDCRVSGHTTFSARTAAKQQPVLEVGNNVDIGWQTTIAVGTRVSLGNNVRIAGRAFLAGYPGHPLNAEERAAGLPEHDDQAGDIILEDDVWLATTVSVMADVTIGKGTIVAAGSVVTSDLPAGVLAGGVPAKVICRLEP